MAATIAAMREKARRPAEQAAPRLQTLLRTGIRAGPRPPSAKVDDESSGSATSVTARSARRSRAIEDEDLDRFPGCRGRRVRESANQSAGAGEDRHQ